MSVLRISCSASLCLPRYCSIIGLDPSEHTSPNARAYCVNYYCHVHMDSLVGVRCPKLPSLMYLCWPANTVTTCRYLGLCVRPHKDPALSTRTRLGNTELLSSFLIEGVQHYTFKLSTFIHSESPTSVTFQRPPILSRPCAVLVYFHSLSWAYTSVRWHNISRFTFYVVYQARHSERREVFSKTSDRSRRRIATLNMTTPRNQPSG